MKEFFNVTSIEAVLTFKEQFQQVATEQVALKEAPGRVLGENIVAVEDIPGFERATMDGYALCAASTYGASDGNPAYLAVVGTIGMGDIPDFAVAHGQAAQISTGGMLPRGADGVVMVEHTEVVDDHTIEVYRSVAPGQNMVARDEDAACGEILLKAGRRLRAQEIGLLAACGRMSLPVFERPRVGIISSGDEVVPAQADPKPGQVRDVNAFTLDALVRRHGGHPRHYGIVKDRFDDLLAVSRRALSENDAVLVSGGSSVGTRDMTVDVLAALPQSRILVHGVSISPGKPTILAQCGNRAFWGLPGHVTSAMVVFMVLVRPFLSHLGGCRGDASVYVPARLARNVASAQGRVDYVRVRLTSENGERWAEPVLGASGLVRTMVAADGLIAIGLNSEGAEQGERVEVMLLD